MKKTVLIISSLALCLTEMSAQVQRRGELATHLGVAASSFKFASPLLDADKDLGDTGFGGNLGVENTFFLYADFGISIGVEVALYSGSMALSNLFNRQQVPTPDLVPGDPPDAGTAPGDYYGNFFHYTLYEGIQESRTAVLLQLPVMLHYQYPMAELIDCTARTNDYLYAAAGCKVGLPLSATYEQTIAAKTVSGYSDATNTIYNNISELGFERFTEIPKESGNATMSKTYIIPSLEVGYKLHLKGEKHNLSAGLYCDFGYAAGLKVSYVFGWGSKLPASARLFKK